MMTTVTDHPAVRAYLARLDRAAAHLPPGRRAELRAEIVGHLAEALPDDAGEARIAAELERLGPPEEIVEAEQGPPAPPAAMEPVGTTHEAVAVVLLTVGSVVPFVGWLVGAILLWTSRLWTTREKLLGTLLVPGGPALVLFAGLTLSLFTVQTCVTTAPSQTRVGDESLPVTTCTGGVGAPGWLVMLAFLSLLALPFVVGVFLYRRAARRAAGSGSPERTSAALGLGVTVAVLVALPVVLGGVVLFSNLVSSGQSVPVPTGVEVTTTVSPEPAEEEESP